VGGKVGRAFAALKSGGREKIAARMVAAGMLPGSVTNSPARSFPQFQR